MIARFLILTAVAFLTPQVLPGVKVKGIDTAALVAISFAVFNLLIGWLLTTILTALSFPLVFVTFGLFRAVIAMVVNAVLLKLASAVLDSFELKSWSSALGMGFFFALGAWLAEFLT